jgi:hypothetical protein
VVYVPVVASSPLEPSLVNKTLLAGAGNTNVNALTAFTAPVAPSVTENVILNSPASASVVDGVIVNTLSACETVAVLPKEPVVTA